MKKKILSLLLAIVSAFGLFAACDSGNSSDQNQPQQIDYAAQVKLDMNDVTSLKTEASFATHIDGDTTHFNVSSSGLSGKIKARYLAVNTPESTGKIEEWGKKASRFTKERLEKATSIVLEADSTTWAVDSTGERYLLWVWYKNAEMTDYRCLNIELLQNGLAVGSKTMETRYGETCTLAIDQAVRFKLNMHSGEKDPDFYYANAIELDLRELCLNREKYLGQRVAFEGIITKQYAQGVYVESFDEETNTSYGMYVYYGFNFSGEKHMQTGYRVRIVGEAGNQFGYQISGLNYNAYDKTNPENFQVLEKDVEIPCNEITADLYTNNSYSITFMEENEDGEATSVTLTKPFLELAHYTHVSMENLYVEKAYITSNGGDNDGAITLTCKADGKTIIVRTVVLKDDADNVITQDKFLNKTIDVNGIIDYYTDQDQYQIKVFSANDINVH